MTLLKRSLLIGAIAVATASCHSDVVAPDEIDTDDIPVELKQLFLFFGDEYGGGSPAPHAFLIKRPGAEPLALTAYHVGGGIEGFAWLRSPLNETIAVRLGERVPIEGAQTIGTNGSQHDLAAFRVRDWNPALALELATDMPQVGDTVFVLAVHIGDPSNPHPLSGPRRHAARVDVSHDEAFVYTYLGSSNSNYTSGAAVLDRDGRVVGVNVGTRAMSASAWDSYRQRYAPCCATPTGGEVVGLAVHVGSIRRMIGGSVIPNAAQR